MWGLFSNKDNVRDKIRDLEREVRSVEYDYCIAVDKLNEAESNGDFRHWDDYAYNLKSKLEDLKYEIRDLEKQL